MPFKQLKKIVKGLGFEVHHLIERRFAKTLGIGNMDEILSVAIDKNAHREITSLMREKIGYRLDLKRTRTDNANPQQIWECLVDVYKSQGMEEYLPILKEYLLDKASKVDEITDWKGY